MSLHWIWPYISFQTFFQKQCHKSFWRGATFKLQSSVRHSYTVIHTSCKKLDPRQDEKFLLLTLMKQIKSTEILHRLPTWYIIGSSTGFIFSLNAAFYIFLVLHFRWLLQTLIRIKYIVISDKTKSSRTFALFVLETLNVKQN